MSNRYPQFLPEWRCREEIGLYSEWRCYWRYCTQNSSYWRRRSHALRVEIGSAGLDSENVPSLRTLLLYCLGLVIAEVFLITAQLARFTLPEHLPSDCPPFRNLHSTTAEVCLIYLNIGYVYSFSLTLRSTLSNAGSRISFFLRERCHKTVMTEMSKYLHSGFSVGLISIYPPGYSYSAITQCWIIGSPTLYDGIGCWLCHPPILLYGT